MPGLDGIAATRVIRRQAPDTHVVMLTTFGDDRSLYGSLKTCLPAGDGRQFYRVGWGPYAAKGGEPAGCP